MNDHGTVIFDYIFLDGPNSIEIDRFDLNPGMGATKIIPFSDFNEPPEFPGMSPLCISGKTKFIVLSANPVIGKGNFTINMIAKKYVQNWDSGGSYVQPVEMIGATL